MEALPTHKQGLAHHGDPEMMPEVLLWRWLINLMPFSPSSEQGKELCDAPEVRGLIDSVRPLSLELEASAGITGLVNTGSQDPL